MKHIVKQIIDVANNLDIQKRHAEADVLTRIAQQLYLPGMKPRITTTYDIVTPESADEGDFAESGWEDEEGVEIDPDEFDIEDGLATHDLAARFLEDKGAYEPSSSRNHRGTWYTSRGDIDYGTGAETSRNYHLEGFSPEDEQRIYERMRKR